MYANDRSRVVRFTAALVVLCIQLSPAVSGAEAGSDWWGGFAPPSSGGQGLDGPVRALLDTGGTLIAGGEFTNAGGISANHVAEWNGSSWEPFGSGTDGTVTSLLSFGDGLVAAGEFSLAGGVGASNVAFWDGAAWSALGGGVNGVVEALASFQGLLIAGGRFTEAGGVSAPYLAAWDGAEWFDLGAGLNGWVFALSTYGDALAVGGWFTSSNGGGIRITSWDGSTWSAPFGPVNGPIWGLTRWPLGSPDALVSTGFFEISGGAATNSIAAWNGSDWYPVGGGMNGLANCAASHFGRLFAGGSFDLADGLPAAGVALWTGDGWEGLGTGIDGHVRALTSHQSSLYVGGDFTEAGGMPSSYIARWDGQVPSDVPDGPDRGPAPWAEDASPRLLAVPNPVRGGESVEFRLQLPGDGGERHVRLAVFDVHGRQVAAVLDRPMSVGTHRIRWDGSSDDGAVLPSGSYFARLEVAGQVTTTKVERLGAPVQKR